MEPKLAMNGTLGEGSSRDLSKKSDIFIINTPNKTPGNKVYDGGSILQKARTITWKATSINPHKHMESLNPTIKRQFSSA